MALCQAFGGMSLGCRTPISASARAFSSSSAMRSAPLMPVQRRQCAARAALLVVAKQNSVDRVLRSARQRTYNKAIKSAVATRMKKVFTAIEGLRLEMDTLNDDTLRNVEKLISQAYQEIDKAISKGVLHSNTGGRRKSRLAIAKQELLVEAGLYSPSAATSE